MMELNIFILMALFLVLMFAGTPVIFALGLPSMLYMFVLSDGMPVEALAHSMTGPLFNFVLIALPAFLLSGRMMNSSGVTNRLFDLAISLVGRLRGGLAYANIVSSMFFASMSGTAVGDAGGIGQIQMKMMKQAGYRVDFAAGLTAASSVLGPIIPPSVAMVILGATAEISISKLFLGGVIPGAMMTIALMLAIGYKAHFSGEGKQWPVEKVPASRIPGDFARAFFPMLTPAIIIGGITTGIVTPTEAAILAIVYSFVLGVLYKEMTYKNLKETLEETVVTAGTFMYIIAIAGFFTWIVTQEGLPMLIGEWLAPLSQYSIPLCMLALGIFFMVIGCFLDTTAAILLVTPTLMPIVRSVGIDPIHFGIVMTVALIVGVITPPFGICLFVLSEVANVPVSAVTREAVRYLPAMIITLLLIIFFEDLVLYLPKLL